MIYSKLSNWYLVITCLLSYNLTSAQVSTGLNTKAPATSSVMELVSTNRGILLPRLLVPNLLNWAPVTPQPADGLLIYNTSENASSGIKNTLFHWDATANLLNGQRNQHIYFKETPKTAVIGLNGANISVLDNADSGIRAYILGNATNTLTISSSGHLPNLSVSKDTYGARINLAQGTYIYEISFLLSAPAPDSGRGDEIGSSYYNMGYFTDVVHSPSLAAAAGRHGRIENAVISKATDQHRMEFSIVLQLTGTQNYIYPTLGRRVGSSHRDLVNIIPSGTFIKITKLK